MGTTKIKQSFINCFQVLFYLCLLLELLVCLAYIFYRVRILYFYRDTLLIPLPIFYFSLLVFLLLLYIRYITIYNPWTFYVILLLILSRHVYIHERTAHRHNSLAPLPIYTH